MPPATATTTTSKSSRAYRTTKFLLLVMSKIPVPSIPTCLKPQKSHPPAPAQPPMSKTSKRKSLQPEILPERREPTLRPERRQSAKRKSLPLRPVSMVVSLPSEQKIVE
ncbi:hypothetical protein CERZMDRAFT_96315 [Cercospora zeae-maydis SCOH1-5]|uniref:Uncharacterized protein n=1 Tax=Cercospora zeae-maydis SCOH1-5 TaxID=717836 RepID=A0A6A6FJR3_9PEZI|nr:hypothetical protein CERZMDRAFT_96315 [Cercospora zeae-maydis SCOH1-5]